MTWLFVAGWVLVVALTIGPIFSAQKNEGDGGWTWIAAAFFFGPLAGYFYYSSRYAMRKAAARNGEAVDAEASGERAGATVPAAGPPGPTAQSFSVTASRRTWWSGDSAAAPSGSPSRKP